MRIRFLSECSVCLPVIAFGAIVLFVIGCDERTKVTPTPKPPQIRVAIDETTEGLKLTVVYEGDETTFERGRRGRQEVTLMLTEQDLPQYHKQVTFLLDKILEAEQKQEKRNSIEADLRAQTNQEVK